MDARKDRIGEHAASHPPAWTAAALGPVPPDPAVGADAELRRRHRGQYFAPLRSAEPEAATDAQRDELTLTADQPSGELGHWISDPTAGTRSSPAGWPIARAR